MNLKNDLASKYRNRLVTLLSEIKEIVDKTDSAKSSIKRRYYEKKARKLRNEATKIAAKLAILSPPSLNKDEIGAKLVTVSSTHGEGKHTLIENVDKEGVVKVYPETAREYMKTNGTTLEEVYSSEDSIKEFQTIILNEHLNKIVQEIRSNNSGIILIERGAIDFYAYAKASLERIGVDVENDEWLTNYRERCVRAHTQVIKKSVVLTGGVHDIVDGVRPEGADFREKVHDYIMEAVSELDYVVIDTPDLEERKIKLTEILENL